MPKAMQCSQNTPGAFSFASGCTGIAHLYATVTKTKRAPLLQVKYAFASLRGLYPNASDKPNQDSLCVHTHYGGDPEQAFFGIFDGHGEFGTECSQFAKDRVRASSLWFVTWKR